RGLDLHSSARGHSLLGVLLPKTAQPPRSSSPEWRAPLAAFAKRISGWPSFRFPFLSESQSQFRRDRPCSGCERHGHSCVRRVAARRRALTLPARVESTL